MFIDWQLSCLNSPAVDILYFLFVSTDKKLRDEHFNSIIKEYYASLSNFATELGSDPQKLFPIEILEEHLIKMGRICLFISLVLINIMNTDSDEVITLDNMTKEEKESFFASFNTKNKEKCNVRIREVILDCVERGYI